MKPNLAHFTQCPTPNRSPTNGTFYATKYRTESDVFSQLTTKISYLLHCRNGEQHKTQATTLDYTKLLYDSLVAPQDITEISPVRDNLTSTHQ